MKNLQLLCIFLSFSALCFSQRITTNEIFELMVMNHDEIDTYLLKKSYVYTPTAEAESFKENCELFVEYSHKEKKYFDILLAKCIYDSNNISISVHTPNEADYLLYKQELKSIGFVYDKTTTEGENVHLYYKLEKGEQLFNAALVSMRKWGSTFYELSITEN